MIGQVLPWELSFWTELNRLHVKKIYDDEAKKMPAPHGTKYDSGKPAMDLLPPLASLEVGKVLGYGANKYSPDGWKTLDNLESRYKAAAMRHILQDASGEPNDSESGLSHLAHAIASLLFVLEHRLSQPAKTVA
mgnify:CR=1 FL=1